MGLLLRALYIQNMNVTQLLFIGGGGGNIQLKAVRGSLIIAFLEALRREP